MTTASRRRAAAVKRWYDFVPDPPPVEDGMLQNPIIEDIASILRLHFKPRADSVLVSGPTFILYDINDPNARIAPDCYVVFDVDAHAIVGHNSYRVWQWGKPPDFALEIASESTALNDLTAKRDIYARIGALEYWRFDPSGGELYGEPLAGERLVDGRYEPYPIHTDADGDIWAHSEALDLDFYMRGDRFWVRDSATGEWLNFIEAEVEAHEVTKLAHEATSLAHDRERQSHEVTRLAYEAEIEAHDRERQSHELTRLAHEAEIEAHEQERQSHEATRLAHEAEIEAHDRERQAHESTRLAHEAEVEARRRERQALLSTEAQMRELRAELDRLRQSE